MVKKSLLVTVLIFVIYSIFISQIRPHWDIAQHQGQENQVKAEKYLYDAQMKNVLVGSSLSCRLDTLSNIYNLAFSGKSALDGLALVTQQAHPISTVFIEMNVIDRDEDSNFTSGLKNPFFDLTKRLFLSLRADKQPLAVVSQRLRGAVNPALGHIDALFQRIYAPTAQEIGNRSPKKGELFEKMLQNQESNYEIIPDSTVFTQRFAKLQKAISIVEKRGAKVVFYEMPVDYHLCDSPKAKAIRHAFYVRFPPTKYHYVPMPDCGQYQTMDGVHLDAESAIRYTQYLRERI